MENLNKFQTADKAVNAQLFKAFQELEEARQTFEIARKKVMIKKKFFQMLQFEALYSGKEATA
jgi:hypothetical protein